MTLQRKTGSPVTLPATMRAISHDHYGGPEVLTLTELPVPAIGDKEVLIEVRAAGMDRGTWHLMHGTPYLVRPAFGFRGPRQPIPGRDVAGVVAAVGSAVTRVQVGDRVFGVAPGSFAEYAVTTEAKLAPIPDDLDDSAAAVLAISGLTALGAVEKGRVAAGQRVLVTGASGGVGSYVVQLVAARGGHVTGVCSAAKADFVRRLGAAEILDYTRDDITGPAQPYDVIIDVAGLTPVRRLRRALTPTGTLVLVGGEGGGTITGGQGRAVRAALRSLFTRQRMIMLVSAEKREGMLALADLVASGQLRPALDREFDLADAAAAMRRLESGAVSGKIAIRVRP